MCDAIIINIAHYVYIYWDKKWGDKVLLPDFPCLLISTGLFSMLEHHVSRQSDDAFP
ncbi:MAG: hypothetical protein GWN33_06015 [Gammaproteobacteria bacterium]|nr:hypothetical protein [Gammaproteobacteria bacterium]